jgi:UDP-3-O-[3-hydroxymyristoyl] glucosamine N-acyltransferase
MVRSFSLADLADQLGAELVGNPDLEISGVGSLEAATSSQLSHYSSRAYRQRLLKTNAGAVLIRPADRPLWSGNAIVVDDPYLAFARMSQLFAEPRYITGGIHATAMLSDGVHLGADLAVGAGVSVGAGTRLGDRTRLHPNCVIGAGCVLGADVEVMPGAVVYDGVKIGDRCVVHANAVLGADGFGFAPDERGRLHEIAQQGGLTLGRDVSVGAGSTIDRGALDDTVIDDGVKIDNQVQIGHNCHIGAHTVICGCVGIVGSTRIGRHCVLAGGVGVGGTHPISICDGVTVSGMTHVSASIDEPGIYSGGVLHSSTRAWKRNALRLQQLDKLFRRVARLEDRDKQQ